jgi:3D (Asp-Asp-Asp) domain-containing protein
MARALRVAALVCVLAAATPGGVARAHVITKPRWLPHTTLTEYFPVPERWFVGARVSAPGLATKHKIDWLYSARGVSMEGDGIGSDGRRYHIQSVGRGGWVDEYGRRTSAGHGAFWRAGAFWKSQLGQLTFPLLGGGWFDGAGAKYVPLPGVSFAPGASLPLRYYSSVAVDPKLIPLGSRIYIPAYRPINGGWFVAQDTGGAILARHIDVYRPAPASIDDGGRYFKDQRVYVVPPRTAAGSTGSGSTSGGSASA